MNLTVADYSHRCPDHPVVTYYKAFDSEGNLLYDPALPFQGLAEVEMQYGDVDGKGDATILYKPMVMKNQMIYITFYRRLNRDEVGKKVLTEYYCITPNKARICKPSDWDKHVELADIDNHLRKIGSVFHRTLQEVSQWNRSVLGSCAMKY